MAESKMAESKMAESKMAESKKAESKMAESNMATQPFLSIKFLGGSKFFLKPNLFSQIIVGPPKKLTNSFFSTQKNLKKFKLIK